ncbi:hypothetical protein N9M10_01440 [Hellea sp.]|nr:hypothetical protein [Hellea sp.]
MRDFISKVKNKVKFTLNLRQKKKLLKNREREFSSDGLPVGAIALPFNHLITMNNAHAVYKSFQSLGKDCVLIDMSGGKLLAEAKKKGIYDKDYNYVLFDFGERGVRPDAYEPVELSLSLSDISIFTETCSKYYSQLAAYSDIIKDIGEDSFIEIAYSSFESHITRKPFFMPYIQMERETFLDMFVRYWLVNLLIRLDAGETDFDRITKQGWNLNAKYMTLSLQNDMDSFRFESFLKEKRFDRAIHFCGPYTLPGVLIQYTLHKAELPCILFHDAFMPPSQMKKINHEMPNFRFPRVYVDILYKDRSSQPAYELDPDAPKVTLRYPIRMWAGYDLLGLPQKALWASWIEYPLERVAVKNTAILNKLKSSLDVDERVLVTGNPSIEKGRELPPEIQKDVPTVLVSVAPDIFSAPKFPSTQYLTSMEEYFDELKGIISIYEKTANVLIALHPRLLPENPHYVLMSKLGRVATSTSGALLPYADVFVTYVGSVMNFDAEDLKVPMIALSLYDNAKSYTQNKFDFENMDIIETSGDMKKWMSSPITAEIRASKYIPELGSTAQKLMTHWAAK